MVAAGGDQRLCAIPVRDAGGRDAHNGTVVVPPDVRPGIPVDEIAAYRWNGRQYVEIPVQVDEQFFYCLSNPASDFAFSSGTDKELPYAWEVESCDRFVRDGVTVTTDTYCWRATGRWMVRDLRVAKPGQPGVFGPDLIDR